MTPANAQEAVQDILLGTFIVVSFITKLIQLHLATNRRYPYPKKGRRGVR